MLQRVKSINASKKRVGQMTRLACGRVGLPNPPREQEDAGSLERSLIRLAMGGKLKNAARNAIRTQIGKGIALTFKRGAQIIKQYPNGAEEILATVERPNYKLPKGVAIISGK